LLALRLWLPYFDGRGWICAGHYINESLFVWLLYAAE
jgi:hypothetical protein